MATLIVEDGTGLTTSTSYCSVAEADAYHENILNGSAWDSAEDQEAALVMATRLLDQHVNWSGIRATKEQALRWPRRYVYDADGYLIDTNTIPAWLKNATAEFARELSVTNRLAAPATAGYRKIKLDTMELHIDKHDRQGVVPASVWSIIGAYGSPYGRSRELVRA